MKLVLFLMVVVTLTSQFFSVEIKKKTLISFKSGACENLALEYQNQIFASAEDQPKFFKNLGVLSVETDIYQLHNKISIKSEFHECIDTIEPNTEIVIRDPVVPTSELDEERKYWQLRRINVRELPLPDSFTRFEVKDVPSHVYIIDSGIDGHHKDFQGRLAPKEEHKSFVDDTCACKNEGAFCDCNGHGTHCAGLVASPEAGYNLHTTLHAAKVFDYSGSTSLEIVIDAMDYVIETHKKYHPNELGVVSMSLGGGYSAIQNKAVKRVYDAGLFITVAAGNSNKDACTGSPASAPEAFTVGASDIDDSRAYFSEYGSCVDIFVPGVKIYSSKPGGDYQFLSGTSMATPFLAGFASFVGTYLRTTDPAVIKNAINGHVTKDVVKNAKSKNNNLPFDNVEDALEHIQRALKYLRGN